MPVSGVSQEKLAARAEYFAYMLDMHASSVAYQNVKLVYHEAMPNILSHVSHALEQAYNKLTEPYGAASGAKLAAIVCATIAAVRPLRPQDPSRPIDADEFIYVNPMFAMRCAASIENHGLHSRSFDDQRLVYKTLTGFSLPIADSIMTEARRNRGEIYADWEAKLDESIQRLFLRDDSINIG